MSYLNVEIKARCTDPDNVRLFLQQNHATFVGTDKQADTYFNTNKGRLKLREGNIENNLIYYERADTAGPKDSKFILVKVEDAAGLKEVLSASMGIKTVVNKKREIYYIDNVKFHIDEVDRLGSFVEIEAGNVLANLNRGQLQQQCDYYVKALGINHTDMLSRSYSDMLLETS
jgi:predicted adenylyl cyclase CyaB